MSSIDDSSHAAPGAKRGRPLRLPEPMPGVGRDPSVNRRVAWLLVVNRIYHPDTRFQSRSTFVAALRDLGLSVDETRISRWETGGQQIPLKFIAAYEDVLGLQPRSLYAVAAGLHASFDPEEPGGKGSIHDPELVHAELDSLFELVSSQQATGADWLRLANDLTQYDRVYLHPRTWLDVSSQLVSELARSTRGAYVRRHEALRMLVRHPGAQRHAVRALGAFVLDTDAPVVSLPLTLLQDVDNKQASEIILRLLTTEHRVLGRAAAWVAATKVARGKFSEDEMATLESVVLRGLTTDPAGAMHQDAIGIAVELPDDGFERVMEMITDPKLFRKIRNVRRSGELVAPEISTALVRKIAARTQTAVAGSMLTEPDLMLGRLIREALFDARWQRRHQAALALSATPYGEALAAECLEVLDELAEATALHALTLLVYLGADRCRADLLERALTDERDTVRSRALLSLGVLNSDLDAADYRTLADLLEEDPDAGVRFGAMFVLGMHGSPILKEIVDTGRPEDRATASWWLAAGSAVRDSDFAGPRHHLREPDPAFPA